MGVCVWAGGGVVMQSLRNTQQIFTADTAREAE